MKTEMIVPELFSFGKSHSVRIECFQFRRKTRRRVKRAECVRSEDIWEEHATSSTDRWRLSNLHQHS